MTDVATRKKAPVYFEPTNADKCHACGEVVYQLEKVGPINGVIYHRRCMRCQVCEKYLTMRKVRTDYTGLSNDNDDKIIYCAKHAPKVKTVGVGIHDVHMQHNIRAQHLSKKGYNENVRMSEAGQKPALTADSMQISGAVKAQRYVQRKNIAGNNAKHQYPAAYMKKKKEITSAQKELEQKQREKEDELYEKFKDARTTQSKQIEKEVDEEWEVKLRELTKNFDKEMKKKGKKDDGKYHTLQFEKEKDDLAKTMTMKRQKKIEYSTLKLKEQEKKLTAELVTQHSKQMVGLVTAKQQELKQLEAEIVNDDDDDDDDIDGEDEEPKLNGDAEEDEVNEEVEKVMADENQNKAESVKSSSNHSSASVVRNTPGEDSLIFMPVVEDGSMPPPKPPSCSKSDLYSDPIIFKELDEEVFNIAENDQQTFTDLVDQLTNSCVSELEKVRAIFRWITVKDLNVLSIAEEIGGDTPQNLLRGIKSGTETYHVLFMRLCSFAGLHCVEIKGHSKSVGYEPGMKIKESSFLNTWNAVHVDGDWRIVQCNWGARHLVLNKDAKPAVAEPKEKKDKIRYQYDEHYFLTDPSDFILEFWPFDPEWQLLDHPISLEQFEQLPFVRSIFFHYNMQLEAGTKAVLFTDEKGGCQLKMRVPEELVRDLVFHHQLRFADDQRRELKDYKGTRLERFVYQTTVDQHIVFSIHVPTVAEYFLEIFANKIDDSNRVSDDPNAVMQPFRLKCACKFRLVCTKMTGKMHPLPNCASGEWGSMKGRRHFNLRPITYDGGVINEENEVELQFEVPQPLNFVSKLHCNNINDHLLEEFVENKCEDGILTVLVKAPVTGQYGLDIFARPIGATNDATLAHACKYLINISQVDNPKQLSQVDSSPPAKITKDKLGAVGRFKELGIRMVSHQDYRIHSTNNPLVIELSHSEPLLFSYHLLREPDEDHREFVNMVTNKEASPNMVEFTLNFPRHGNYLFAIYAQERSKKDKVMGNVCNYLISHMVESPNQKDKGSRRNSGAGLKGLFGKNKSFDKS